MAEMLTALASDLLSAAAHVLDTSSVVPDAPELQYVSIGRPAHDCELLVVYIEPIIQYPVNPASAGCFVRFRATLNVELIRCSPTLDEDGNPPDMDTLAAAGIAHANDGNVLLFGLQQMWQDGSLLPSLPQEQCCSQMAMQRMAPVGPDGGFAGWRVTWIYDL